MPTTKKQRPALSRKRKANRRVRANDEAMQETSFQRFRRIWLPIGVSLVSVAATCAIVFYGWNALKDSDQLRVKSLEVLGNKSISSEEISSYAGLALGQAIFHVDLDAVSRNLKRHPWIDKAYVRRRLPDGIRIHVSEHAPKVLVALENVYLADQQGNIFKRWQGEDVKALPVVAGLNSEEAKDNPTETRKQILEAIKLYETIEANRGVLGPIDEIAYPQLKLDLDTQDDYQSLLEKPYHIDMSALEIVRTTLEHKI